MTIPLVLSLISLSLCVIFFFFFRWYIKRKTAARELLSDYRTEVNHLIAQIDAATDRDSLLVEERIKILRKLLDDTDRRISVYMRELQNSRRGEALYSSLGRGIRAALRLPEESLTETPQEDVAAPEEPKVLTGGSRDNFGSEGGGSFGAVSPPAEVKPTKEPKRREKKKPVKQAELALTKEETVKPIKVQIAEMSAQGLASSEIASRLHISLAEVDLALNLLYRPGSKN